MRHPYAPDRGTTLVLRAGLDEPAAAGAAWRSWLGLGNTVDAAPHHVVRMLPLVHRNLSAHDAGLPERGRLAGLYRRNWYGNQLQLRAAASALAVMRERGVEAMLIKGAALMADAPALAGTRAMWDVDVLVREHAVDVAARALTDSGYAGRLQPPGRRALHAVAFRRDGAQVDLHLRPAHQAMDAGGLWTAAATGRLQGAEVMIPGREDRIVLAALHAMSPHNTTVDWVADVVLTLRGGCDWVRLVERAAAARAAAALGAALEVAGAIGAVAVPVDVGEELAARASAAERALLAVTTARWGSPRAATYLTLADVYRAEAERPSAGGFLAFFADLAGAGGRRALAGRWARRAGARARQRLAGSRPPSRR